MSKKFSIVGKEVIRQDGYAKVTGSAKFADDIIFTDMLFGVMVRTHVVHALIKNIDFSAIENNPALTTIITAEDIPGAKKVGPIKKDQPVFCYDKVVTSGDVLAMLVGKDESELRKLVDNVKIEYNELPVVTDPENALNDNTPLIHPENKTNLINHYPLLKGDVKKGFAESDYVIERRYTTSYQEHAYIEPETVIAYPFEGNNGIKVIGSIQNPYTARRVVSEVMGIPLADVRIEQAELGGSFGGKDDTMNILAARAAVAALKTGQPIKIKFGREESIIESYKRHPYRLNYKVGFNSDGKIKAMKIDILADGGAYASMSPFATWRTVVQATGPYEIENVETNVNAVYTNNPYTGAMRGFGSPQPIFAQESLMDEIAAELNISPLKVRTINGFKAGSITASGQKLDEHEVSFNKVLEKAGAESCFNVKWNKYRKENNKIDGNFIIKEKQKSNNFILNENQFIDPENTWRRGIGLSVSFRGCSLGAEGIDAVTAYLSLQPDGSIHLSCGLAENGQGLRTTFSIIVSEVLGIPIEDVHYLNLDTGHNSDSGPTVASRSTLMGGGAVQNASSILKERLKKVFYKYWNINKDCNLIFNSGLITYGNGNKKITFKELCSLAYNDDSNMSTLGLYAGPKVDWDEESGQGNAYFTYVYGCQVAEVSVNISTGEVYVNKVIAVHDAGTVINLLGSEGQVYGGVTQGAGFCLWEELNSEEGKIKELNFDQYLIPTCKDIDEIKPFFVEGNEKYGPWGAKSLGEPTLELTSAAIANAIFNATGVRYRNLPINLEEIILLRKLRPDNLKRGSA
ncbi:MAG: xanthine dehydrogenase family protein [Ignavibacteria bacterium]|nr:xanthine dehydrogenase family protein [Ignavibacteria bacterium]